MEKNKRFGRLDKDNKIEYIDVPFKVKVQGQETYWKIHPTEEECNLMSCYEIQSIMPVEEGYFFTKTEYGDLVENKILRRYERHEEPKVYRKWTPLTIKRGAVLKNWWESLRQTLVDANLLEDFWGAQVIAEDDPQYPMIYSGMVQMFGKEEVDDFLNKLPQE